MLIPRELTESLLKISDEILGVAKKRVATVKMNILTLHTQWSIHTAKLVVKLRYK